MELLHRQPVGTGGAVNVAVTDRGDGDLAIVAPGVGYRRREVVDRPWRWLRQVHGAVVVDGDRPGAGRGEEGDALVSVRADAALSVQAADCVSMAVISDDGPFAVVHAGWRGLLAGVVAAAVEELRGHGPAPLRAAVGPFIRVGCYEFGDELDQVVDRFGSAVAGRTTAGRRALDLTAAVRQALVELDVEVVADDGRCTCAPELYSHRLAGDTARHAVVAWRER